MTDKKPDMTKIAPLPHEKGPAMPTPKPPIEEVKEQITNPDEKKPGTALSTGKTR